MTSMFTDFTSFGTRDSNPLTPTPLPTPMSMPSLGSSTDSAPVLLPAYSASTTPLLSSATIPQIASPSGAPVISSPAPLQQQAYALLAQRSVQSVFAFTDNLKDLLALTQVDHIAPTHPDKKWHALLTSTTVQQALSELKTYDLLSMPVLDPSTDICVGFIDVVDLMGYLFYVCAQPIPGADLSLPSLTRVFEAYSNEPISKVIDFSKRNPLVSVLSNEKMLSLLRSLKTAHGLGIHRFAITNVGSSEIVQILSQSDVIRYIAKHISVLGPQGHMPISRFITSWPRVISVLPQSKALDAFYAMYTQNLSAVAVIDNQGLLVANLSASDLRQGLSYQEFHRLFLPVVDFIKEINIDKQEVLTPPICATPDTPLETILLRLAATGKHRIYIVDTMGHVLGVISLTDLLGLLLTHFAAPGPSEVA